MLNGSFSAIVGYKFIITARNQAFFEEFVSININQRGRKEKLYRFYVVKR